MENKTKNQTEVGDIIRVINMFGIPQYQYKEGIVYCIDEEERKIYGTWGTFPLFFNDDWEIIGKGRLEIIDFIEKRFPKDSNWIDGNCYYFALILKDRFPEGKILYDTIDGHFVTEIDGVNYDWSGVVSTRDYHYYVEWDKFDEYDTLQRDRIIKDCIL